MPLTHTAIFRVRQYECDLYGHVNNAVYLRYVQETALRASAAAGLDRNSLAEMDLREWMPAIDIEYLAPLFYGETVEVTARPIGVGGGFYQQGYEFRKAGSGDLAARAAATSVFLSLGSGQAAPVPPAQIRAYFPDGSQELTRAGASFRSAPPQPIGTFKTRRCVAWNDVNAAQEVDHATLLAYIEDCGRQVVAAHGWPMERMLTKGFAILLRRNQIEYLRPAIFDEELELATWASNVRRVTATRHYTVMRVRDGEILARVNALGVWVNLETGQPIHIPPDLLADFKTNIVP